MRAFGPHAVVVTDSLCLAFDTETPPRFNRAKKGKHSLHTECLYPHHCFKYYPFAASIGSRNQPAGSHLSCGLGLLGVTFTHPGIS